MKRRNESRLALATTTIRLLSSGNVVVGGSHTPSTDRKVAIPWPDPWTPVFGGPPGNGGDGNG
jgi:hypothetical protein